MIVVIKIIITNNNIDNHKSELFFGQLLMLLETQIRNKTIRMKNLNWKQSSAISVIFYVGIVKLN